MYARMYVRMYVRTYVCICMYVCSYVFVLGLQIWYYSDIVNRSWYDFEIIIVIFFNEYLPEYST